jgi:hypothetical protein
MNMDKETDTLSGWFVLNAGFKVYGRCPDCHSPRITYYKSRYPGLKGISPSSKGITPVCIDCGKSIPHYNEKEHKPIVVKRKEQRAF